MRRRDFICVVGSAAAWPLAAHAQQSTMPVIGFLSSIMASESVSVVAAFHQGLKEIGYVEGQNVSIELTKMRRIEEANKFELVLSIKALVARALADQVIEGRESRHGDRA